MPVCCCTRSASDTKVGDTEPKSKIRSGFACSTTSTLAVSPRPVSRPNSGRSRAAGRMNSRSFGRGALGQPIIFSGASTYSTTAAVGPEAISRSTRSGTVTLRPVASLISAAPAQVTK